MSKKNTSKYLGTCIECKEKPAIYYKWQLCDKCYQQKRRSILNPKKESKTVGVLGKTNIQYHSEMDFVKNYFNHDNWLYEPATFKLNDTTYTPDFYDGERNIFIEVAGTVQALAFNKNKYLEFKKRFPKITLEIRRADGELYTFKDSNKEMKEIFGTK